MILSVSEEGEPGFIEGYAALSGRLPPRDGDCAPVQNVGGEHNCYKFCWIVDFPFYEKDPETGKIIFSHNPFSMPQGGLEALNTNRHTAR